MKNFLEELLFELICTVLTALFYIPAFKTMPFGEWMSHVGFGGYIVFIILCTYYELTSKYRK